MLQEPGRQNSEQLFTLQDRGLHLMTDRRQSCQTLKQRVECLARQARMMFLLVIWTLRSVLWSSFGPDEQEILET
jgi:hypothetical protein